MLYSSIPVILYMDSGSLDQTSYVIAQADLSFCRLHIDKGPFVHVKAKIDLKWHAVGRNDGNLWNHEVILASDNPFVPQKKN